MQGCPYIHRHPFGAPVRTTCFAGHHSGQPAPCPNSPRIGHQTTRVALCPSSEMIWSVSPQPRASPGDQTGESSLWPTTPGPLGPLSGPGTSPVVRMRLPPGNLCFGLSCDYSHRLICWPHHSNNHETPCSMGSRVWHRAGIHGTPSRSHSPCGPLKLPHRQRCDAKFNRMNQV